VPVTEPPPPLPALPEPLLAPVLEVAATVLRALEAAEIPASMRKVATFDRRGLAKGPGRAQLHRGLEAVEGFRDKVVEKFLDKPEVSSVLDAWEPERAAEAVAESAAAGRLPALVSARWAGRPPGSDFALGLALAAWEAGQRSGQEAGERRSLEERLATVEEAARRAEEARRTAEQERARLDAELREERKGRKARERQATAEVSQTARRVAELEAELAAARAEVEAAKARTAGEAARAARAEEAERAARARLQAAESSAPPAGAVSLEALGEAGRMASRLAETLARLTRGSPTPGRRVTPATPPAPPGARHLPGPRRAPVVIPPGMRDDSLEAAEAMVRTPGLDVVVDGYNVSMAAWGEAPPAEQRDRLCAALAELHLRIRRPVTIVFDGAEVEGVRPPRRPGLKVLFSAPGQEADEIVVEEVAARPPEVPVLVVSSDGWVREHAQAEGAQVIPVSSLLALLRR
jgi:hypothetical protein